MKIERKFTTAGQDAYAALNFVTTSSEIRNPDGSTVFRLDEIEVDGGIGLGIAHASTPGFAAAITARRIATGSSVFL